MQSVTRPCTNTKVLVYHYFLVYIHMRTGSYGSLECGASLIDDQFLIGAKHCLPNFHENCYDQGQCFASFRKLNKKIYQVGEFTIAQWNNINRADAILKILPNVQLLSHFNHHVWNNHHLPKLGQLSSVKKQKKVQADKGGKKYHKKKPTNEILKS